MKKKRYKKLIKKINKLKKLIESNSQQSIVSVWNPELRPQEWEVTYGEPEPYYASQSN